MRLAVPGGGNRDFVLRYRLAGDKIESGVLLWEGEGGGGRKENFFALMMEPPQRPTAAQIPPREYIFLLDVSGSMHGFPLDTAKALMRNLLGRLRPTDTFNVALFSGAAHVMSPGGSIPARKEEIARAIAEIEKQQGGGGTELMGGLEMSYKIPRRNQGVSRTVVVVTDGYVGVEAQAFRFIRERLSEANLFAFGIGSGVNRGLIEGMARAGQGEPFVVLRPDKAAEEADKLRAMIEQPVLTHVNVAFAGLDAYEVAPQKLPDLMARRPLVLFGKYRGPAGGRIEITGSSGGGRLRQTVEVRPGSARAGNAALRWLWARRWVDTLEDERAMGAGKPAEDGITALGLDYKLLTAFTSFVAVDSQVVNAGGNGKSVRQPLPMPEGVSNLAVADEALSGLASPGAHGGMMFLNAPAKGREKASDKSAGGFGGMGTGAGVGHGAAGSAAQAPRAERSIAMPAPSAPPPQALARRRDDSRAADAKGKKDARPAQAAWVVTVGQTTALAGTGPLVEAVRAALASGRAACLAGGAPGQGLRVRLTIDARGKVQRVELVAGDRGAEGCLRALFARLASSTVAQGAGVGTVELTIVRR